ncbi:MAG: T9SS C-terminal target domain-containing protein [Balneolaceae bacterium]|nr:MAG: T9SS C-terminal target domain-containing protein [Balneolaceae bacterium]
MKILISLIILAWFPALPPTVRAAEAPSSLQSEEQPRGLPLPERPADAPTGSQLEQQLRNLSLQNRENAIYSEIMSGNIPDFLREMVEVNTTRTINGTGYTLQYHVLPDYLALGSNDDYFLMPMTPLLAQRLCNALSCSLPTRRMVDQIWQAAPLKLSPQPIPPSDQMTTIPVMYTHHQMVLEQREGVLEAHPQGTLVGGHKKDVIVSNRIYNQPPPGRVVIYGWHNPNGSPIQPVYSGHSETYADYSHGIRAVCDTVIVNGEPAAIRDILRHPELHELLSDEGPIEFPFYPLETTLRTPDAWGVRRTQEGNLQLVMPEVPDATSYRVHLGDDGRNFSRVQNFQPGDAFILDASEPETPVYLRLQVVSDHAGPYSEVLAGFPSASPPRLLLVNGFDRPISGNTRDFVRHYIPEVIAHGHGFDSATNEAVADGLILLDAYDAVLWILGAESTADETFSSAEQARVQHYLDGGGSLFVSGSEIGWDLDHRGSAADRAFIHNYLKSAYMADAPGNQRDTWYQAEGAADGPFSAFSTIMFDNGTQGTWNVSWPDVLSGISGGEILMRYTGAPAPNGAATGYKGSFPGSTAGTEGVVLVLGFPFETVYPAGTRQELMGEILTFLLDPVASSIETGPNLGQRPITLRLEPNYPNPFNHQTRLRYHLPESTHVHLVIYNATGQHVHELVNAMNQAGTHEVRWDATGLASGMYISALTAGGQTLHRSMMLLK